MVKEFNDVVFTTGKVGKVSSSVGAPLTGRLLPAMKVGFLSAHSRELCWMAQVEGPVKTQFGYHLILITKRGDESM